MGYSVFRERERELEKEEEGKMHVFICVHIYIYMYMYIYIAGVCAAHRAKECLGYIRIGICKLRFARTYAPPYGDR